MINSKKKLCKLYKSHAYVLNVSGMSEVRYCRFCEISIVNRYYQNRFDYLIKKYSQISNLFTKQKEKYV